MRASYNRTAASLRARGIRPVFDPEAYRISYEDRQRKVDARAIARRVAEAAGDDRRNIALRRWLRSADPAITGKLTAGRIIRRFARATGLEPGDVTGFSRRRRIVRVRDAAMYWCSRRLGLTMPDIGRRFGGRDHSTVLHAVRKVEARLGPSGRRRRGWEPEGLSPAQLDAYRAAIDVDRLPHEDAMDVALEYRG